MDLIAALPNVPIASLPTIAEEIQKFGAVVEFWTSTTGYVESISGRVRFVHDGEKLYVFLEVDAGHFPRAIVVGGTRQIVYESVELYHRRLRWGTTAYLRGA